MITSATSSARDIIRSPFTPSQWQELEHQALIFKYMVSGVPVPSELIYSVKRSLDSSLASRLFPHQPIGWGCFQVGFGRKADPEPGRCRRTDGKKWRCSKEAYPDSKYCERHMHRGRNRSRKPVEITSSSSSTSSTTSTTTATLISSTSPNTSSSLLNRSNLSINNNNITTTTTPPPQLSTDIYNTHQDPTQKSTYFNPFLYPQKSTYVSTGFSSPHDQNTTHQLFLDSGSCSDKDYRYFHGTKEGVVDERDFFPEASGSVRGVIHQHDSCQPLMTNCFKGYSHDQSQFHQSFSDNSKPPQQQQQPQQHCFVLGTDFKSSSSANPLKIEKEEPDDTQKQLHHFFGEWPPKNTDSWLDLASNSRVHNWYYSSIMDSNTVQKSPCLVGHQ